MTGAARITRTVAWTVACTLALMAAPALLLAQARQPAFPHAKHQRLFPSCVGCHAGIPAGDAAKAFPAATLCASCHDGVIKPRVDWTPSAPGGPGLLAFSHPSHFSKAVDVTCASCHAAEADTAWMDVARAEPAACLRCHAHSASAHLAADNTCSTCHRPLAAATGMSEASIAALPKPASHAGAGFVEGHGTAATAPGANCATCHARESCARCHVNAGQSKVISALGSDPLVARLVAKLAPVYPTPADHLVVQFGLDHGGAARANVARCATCHARASCETCHTGEGARSVIRQLPDARGAGARGVQLQRVANPTVASGATTSAVTVRFVASQHGQQPDTGVHRVLVHPAGFARSHGPLAASGELQCTSCHAQRFCTDCHVGERSGRGYHPSNFVSTHPAKAYGRDTECSSCHNVETFCRSCHQQVGVAAKAGVRSTVFHNAQPYWLLEHGRAARQDLTNCTSCHQQTYCMQCHSDIGARINPHGPDFNAAAMAKRNPAMCLMCHLKFPSGGN